MPRRNQRRRVDPRPGIDIGFGPGHASKYAYTTIKNTRAPYEPGSKARRRFTTNKRVPGVNP